MQQDDKNTICLQGSLEYFTIYDILMLLHLGRKTGVLYIENKEEKRQIFLHQGIIVFARSSDYRDSLAKYLIDNNYVTSELINKGHKIMKQYPSRYKTSWDILVEKNLLKAKDLKIAAEYNISQTIYSLFRWKEGHFYFNDHAKLPEHAEIVNIDPQSLIMEGVRMSDEWEEIHKDSPKEDIVLEVNPDIDPNNPGLELTEIEWKVLGRVNGHRSVIDICKEIRYLNEYETLKVLTDLYKKSIVLPISDIKEDSSPGESTYNNISIFSLETLNTSTSNKNEAATPKKEATPSKHGPQRSFSPGIRNKLVITENGIKKGTIIISGEPVTIGTSNASDIPVRSATTDFPDKYATIYLNGMNFFIRANTNVSLIINNQEFREKELERFDEIQIGETAIIFS